MPHCLGIDIGSTAVKAALLTPDGRLSGVWSRPIIGLPDEALAGLVDGIPDPGGDVRIGITGTGRGIVKARVHELSEVVALARAVSFLSRDARTAIEIGGQSARFVVIEEGSGTLLEFGMNQQCAAGSGSFFEQQAVRLGLDVEAFARLSAGAPRGATVAGRCSVFAKSDMVHLQQKGTPVGEIAYGLCLAMARNFTATVIRGRGVVPPLILAGGSARNEGLVRALAEVLGLEPGSLRISPHPGAEGAVGAALSALELGEGPTVAWTGILDALDTGGPRGRSTTLEALSIEPGGPAALDPPAARRDASVFMGVDVGSVSTNLVLLDGDAEIIEGIYLPTRGRPIEAIGRGLDLIRERFGEGLDVLGVAVTGSGRHLASHILGADIVKNEITCQLEGAVEIVPDVDTIFEIGGQDSKYIHVSGSSIDEFVMNKICAAGTGSFLEEQADNLGVEIVDDFSRLAAESTGPVDLGCQCTVFMHSEVVEARRRGTSIPDICAGLAYSVARNYLDRVVAGRRTGRSIVFQGGVAHNPAVVAAFRHILGVPVHVHPHAGLSGAIGAAHLVRRAPPESTAFRGFDSCRDHEMRSFECKSCTNRCQVNQIRIDGDKIHFGDACEKYSSRVAGSTEDDAPDLPALWQEVERSYLEPPPSPRGRIGIPRASALLDQLPFWHTFFASLGYEAVHSRPSSQTTLQAGLHRLPAETCLPIKLAFGHVQELAEAGVDHVFLPSILTRPGDEPRYSHSCPYVQAVPYMVRAAISASFLTPEVNLSGGEEPFSRGMGPLAFSLGVDEVDIQDAYHDAVSARDDFHERLVEAGRETLERAGRAIVVIGKPYNVLDPYLNMNMMQHLRRLGETAIPMWCLPIEEQELDPRSERLPWHMNRAIVRAVSYCVRDDRLFPVIVSNFGCGPDAFTQPLLEQMLDGRPSLFLEFDEHRAEAGLVTRLEAFLDEIDGPGRPASHADRALEARSVEAPPAAERRSFVLPYFSDHAHVFSGALRAAGHETRILPLPSEEIRLLGEAHTSGKECHPYSLLTGDLVHLARSERRGGEAFFFPGTSIPCLLHQYGDGHRLLLERMGVSDLSVVTPGFGELKDLLGVDIGARMWRGLVAVDLLIKMVCETRPYELERGQTDEAHRRSLEDIEVAIATDELSAALTMVTSRLRLIPVDRSNPRPVVGVAGDIFTRINPVGNQDLFTWLEERGYEVWPAPFLVDITDFSLRRSWETSTLGEAALLGALMVRKNVESWRARRMFRGKIKRVDEPGYQEVLDMAKPYLGEQQNEVLVLNVAKMVDFARRGVDGIVNALCFNCMLGTVSASITTRIRRDHDSIPITNLLYSSVEGSQRAMLEAFLHQVEAHTRKRSRTAAVKQRETGLLARLWPSD
ncbi:MAG: hypothetical protein JRG91_14330 [Deltaproteobacteria bacterium]|nr:hypothetical protein [Deltaproteobacteria bacterium]